MPKAAPALVSFSAGELSPLLYGRIDVEQYGAGLRSCLNFIPIPQGGLCNRPGTRYVGIPHRNDIAPRLHPFEFSTDESYMLELGEFVMRIWKARSLLEITGTPIVVATPWSSIYINQLQFAQSADVLYVTHPVIPPYKITRYSETDWRVEGLLFNTGPFMDDHNGGITLAPDAVTGTCNITASANYFEAGHVGALFVLWADSINVADLQPWEPDIDYPGASRVYYNGRIYSSAGGGTSGTNPPVHEDGIRWDGQYNLSVQWTFESSFFGVVRITTVTGPTTATAGIVTRLPVTLTSDPAVRWAEGSWSPKNGYPGAIAFYQDRLVMAGTDAQPDTVWMSGSGDYLNFGPRDSTGIIAADLAISLTVSSQLVNRVRWLVNDGGGLLCGTIGNEFLIAPASAAEALSQSNLRVIPQTNYGSAEVQPIQAGGATLYVQRGGRKIRQAIYDYAADRYSAPDLTLFAEHMTHGGGIVDMAFQKEPYSILWVVLGDGSLRAMTYDREQGIVGWHRHLLGGIGPNGGMAEVETVATIPSPSGDGDDVWISVLRTINFVTVRTIEVLDFDRAPGDAVVDAFHMDCGATYDGVPATTIGGFSHLIGDTIKVVADGAVRPDEVVNGSGQIVLSSPASVVHGGYFSTAEFEPMRLEAGSANGTAQAKIKRIEKISVRVFNSIGGKAGNPTMATLDGLLVRDSASPMSAGTNPYSGDKEVTWPYKNEREGRILIRQDQPLPLNVLAVYPVVRTQD